MADGDWYIYYDPDIDDINLDCPPRTKESSPPPDCPGKCFECPKVLLGECRFWCDEPEPIKNFNWVSDKYIEPPPKTPIEKFDWRKFFLALLNGK